MKELPSVRQLRYLVALTKHRHFGRAARSCLVTQSTLSAGIMELERRLGVALVERGKRAVFLTALGEQVVGLAHLALRGVEDIVDAVRGAGQPLTGVLRLGVVPTISPFLLPRVLPALRAAYPGLHLYLHEERTALLLRRLAAGELDLLLLAFPYPLAGAHIHTFADDPFVVACPREHPFARAKQIETTALAQERMLLLEEGHCLRDQVLGICHLGDDGSRDGFQATSLYTLVQMVDNGLGITVLPKMAVDAGVTEGTGLAVRALADCSAARQIGLAWRKSSTRKPEFRLLGNFFRDALTTPSDAG